MLANKDTVANFIIIRMREQEMMTRGQLQMQVFQAVQFTARWTSSPKAGG
jgi:hypothetical protein